MANPTPSAESRRLIRLEAAEALRNLVALYARAADRGNDPALMRRIFSEDAEWEARGFGSYRGAEAIAEALARIAAEQVLWSLHVMGPPYLEIADDLASAAVSWRLWELSQMARPGAAPRDHWLGGGYEAEAVWSAADGWRFRKVTLELSLIAPTGEAWRPEPQR